MHPAFLHRLIAPFLLMIAGVAATGAAGAATVEGTATYRERMLLPPNAVFEAVVVDISRADAAADVLGRAVREPAGNPPFRFSIAVDPARVKPGGRYAVRATVRAGEQLLFTTDRVVSVLDGRNAPVELLLVRAGGSRGGAQPPRGDPRAALGALPASFAGELPGAGGPVRWHVNLLPDGRYRLRMTTVGKPEPNTFDDIGRWTIDAQRRLVLRGGREAPVFFAIGDGSALQKLDLEGKPIASLAPQRLARLPAPEPIEAALFLRGMFTYMADAASIVLCADGSRVPVSDEGDYRVLEWAYLDAIAQGRTPGTPLLASVEGRLAVRPSAEESQPPRETLVVDRFVGVYPGETCGNPLAKSPLTETYWKLVRLGESPVAPASAKPREAHLVIQKDGKRVVGSGGCNRFFGGVEVKADRIKFGQLGATMMACPDGTDREREYFTALGRAARYVIEGSHLDLHDEAGALVARFEAVALRR
jgi:copper homeostasis protein (lipoprotein)